MLQVGFAQADKNLMGKPSKSLSPTCPPEDLQK
jgi:hypothetical protein